MLCIKNGYYKINLWDNTAPNWITSYKKYLVDELGLKKILKTFKNFRQENILNDLSQAFHWYSIGTAEELSKVDKETENKIIQNISGVYDDLVKGLWDLETTHFYDLPIIAPVNNIIDHFNISANKVKQTVYNAYDFGEDVYLKNIDMDVVILHDDNDMYSRYVKFNIKGFKTKMDDLSNNKAYILTLKEKLKKEINDLSKEKVKEIEKIIESLEQGKECELYDEMVWNLNLMADISFNEYSLEKSTTDKWNSASEIDSEVYMFENVFPTLEEAKEKDFSKIDYNSILNDLWGGC